MLRGSGGRALRWLIACLLLSESALSVPKIKKKSAKELAAEKKEREAKAKEELLARSYRGVVQSWHTAAPPAPLDAKGKPKLVLFSVNRSERLVLESSTERGGFSAGDLEKVNFLFRSASGIVFPIAPDLVDLLYRVQTGFQSGEIRVVSGFRLPKSMWSPQPLAASSVAAKDTKGKGKKKAPKPPQVKGASLSKVPGLSVRARLSNHNIGRAVDFVVAGANNDDVAKMMRSFGFVGVGIYPVSGFMHLDVRHSSYFWIDRSAPGKRNRESGIFPELAKESDHLALARGQAPVGSFTLGTVSWTTPELDDPTLHDHEDDEEEGE